MRLHLRRAGEFQTRRVVQAKLSWKDAEGTLGDELHVDFVRDDAALVTFAQQTPNGFAATLGVIERQGVYPHRDEAIGERRIHLARKLQRVLQSILAIVERIANALFQEIRNFANRLFAELTTNRVAAHRQRQTAGVLVPPLTEIEDFVQTVILIERSE